MIAFDFTWAHPTPPQMAALALARAQKPRHVTDLQAAEIICTADAMLWYSLVKGWAVAPPAGAPDTWKAACATLIEIVELSYSPQHGWWYMGAWPKMKSYGAVILLMDLGHMIRQARQHTFLMVPASLDVIIDLICGRNWEKQYAKILATLQGAAP